MKKLPGIGKTIAERIVEFHQQNGAVKSMENLAKVKGIGKAAIDKLRDMLAV